MDGLYVGLAKLRLRRLEPLECSKAETDPLIEAGKQPPPPEVGNWPLQPEVENWPPQPEAGNKLPQGIPLTCPRRERELVMAGRGLTGPSRKLNGKRVEVRALHTRLALHQPGGGLSAKFMSL